MKSKGFVHYEIVMAFQNPFTLIMNKSRKSFSNHLGVTSADPF